ncbi:MAG: hypothetical protein KME31_10130 [Tolypothrix carrinoi HA7290-LM1]|nr:hypothetical protein [Tolypothrix carrinoi HA7290-LM1]
MERIVLQRVSLTVASLIPIAHCPMTADAPLGETPRPHCLPNAQLPI